MAESLPNFDALDPFTAIYQALFSALLDPLAGVAALVDEANRTDLTAATPTIRNNVECSDLPELILAQADWTATPGNSKAKESTQAYPLRIATSKISVVDLNRLKWEVWKALEKAGDSLGLSYVRGWAIRTASDSIAREGENRGDEKWVTVANIVVTMAIPRASLTA